jgi:YD repeat-containing protein
MYAVMVALAFGFAFALAGCGDKETTLREEAPAAPPPEATLPAEEAAPEEAVPEAPKIYAIKAITTNFLDIDEDDTDEAYSTTVAFSYENGSLSAVTATHGNDEKGDKTVKRDFEYENGRLSKLNGPSLQGLLAVEFKKFSLVQLKDLGKFVDKPIKIPTKNTCLFTGDCPDKTAVTPSAQYTYVDDKLSKYIVSNASADANKPDEKFQASQYEKELRLRAYRGKGKTFPTGNLFKDIRFKFNDAGILVERTAKKIQPLDKDAKTTLKYDDEGRLTEEKTTTDPDATSQETRTLRITYKDGVVQYATYEILVETGTSSSDTCYVTEALERNDAGLLTKEKVSAGNTSCKGWKDEKKIKPIAERTFEWKVVDAEPAMPSLTAILDDYGMDLTNSMHSLVYVEQPKKIFSINWPNQ